jgi:hypothetical protein
VPAGGIENGVFQQKKGSLYPVSINVDSNEVILTVAGLIDLGGALIVFGRVVEAFAEQVRRGSPERARLVVADGVLAALAFVVASTLLRTMALRGWHQIGMFAFVLTLRTLLKQVFDSERKELLRSEPAKPA